MYKTPNSTSRSRAQSKKKVWVVFVRKVGIGHVALVQRYGFHATKQPGTFWRRFNSRAHAQDAVRPFISAGLHGTIKNQWLVPSRRRACPNPRDHYNPHANLRHGGFGGRLNATPIKGAWRRRRPKT